MIFHFSWSEPKLFFHPFYLKYHCLASKKVCPAFTIKCKQYAWCLLNVKMWFWKCNFSLNSMRSHWPNQVHLVSTNPLQDSGLVLIPLIPTTTCFNIVFIYIYTWFVDFTFNFHSFDFLPLLSEILGLHNLPLLISPPSLSAYPHFFWLENAMLLASTTIFL